MRLGAVGPAEVLAAGDLALWYDEAAGTEWLRALPAGNGRLGAMVFGNTTVERLRLNEEDTAGRAVTPGRSPSPAPV